MWGGVRRYFLVLRLGTSFSGMKDWIYIITHTAHPGMVKIGFSTKDPEYRARDMGTSSPYPYVVQYKALVDEGQRVEHSVHKHFASIRENKDREWFKCSLEEAIIGAKQVALGSLHFEAYRDPILENSVANWGKPRVANVQEAQSKSGAAKQKSAIGVAFSLGRKVVRSLFRVVFWSFRQIAIRPLLGVAVLAALSGYAFYHWGLSDKLSHQPSEPPKIALDEHPDLEPIPPRQGNTSAIPTLTPPPTQTRTLTPTPSAILTPRPVQTEEDGRASQLWAMAKFPELRVEGSRLNRAFLATVRRYRNAKSEIFYDPDWPTKLATEAAESLK